MATTTLETKAARRTRTNPARSAAARLVCREAYRAYRDAHDLLVEIAEINLKPADFDAFEEFVDNRLAETELALIDALLLAGEPYETEGRRFSALPDPETESWILNIEEV